MEFIVGIDPGKYGGWAVASKDRIEAYGMMPLSGNEINVRDLADMLFNIGPSKLTVVIERVHSMPKMGMPSMFNFGMSYGKLIGMCQTVRAPYELVLPTTWKKSVLFDTKRDKFAAIEFVSRRFPYVNLIPEGKKSPKDGIADAICIAHWGVNKWLTPKT